MAVIALNIDPKLYADIEISVSAGKYSDVQQFFVVAARNQLALEASVGTVPAVDSPAPDSPASGEEMNGDHAVLPSDELPGGVRALLSSLASTGDSLSEPVPLDDPDLVLWGQVNRVLPIAVGVRALGHLSALHGGPIPVEEWHEAATRAAVALRPYVRGLDQAAGRRHGSLWSTALPDDTDASAHRYSNQFLGFPRAEGVPDGAAAFLGLVAFDDDGLVGLTAAGADWAALANPIFDSSETPATTFSVEESAFFLDHLRHYRPAEWRFLQRVASLVQDGLSRTQLDDALAAEYPAWAKYIGTMCAGALGRLSDLGLLERERRGLTVDYALTPLAADLGLTANQEAGAA